MAPVPSTMSFIVPAHPDADPPIADYPGFAVETRNRNLAQHH